MSALFESTIFILFFLLKGMHSKEVTSHAIFADIRTDFHGFNSSQRHVY